LSKQNARPGSVLWFRHRSSLARGGGIGALGLVAGLALALSCAPASAKAWHKHAPKVQETEHVSKAPFGDIPQGPLQMFISIDQQKLHLYSDGVQVADTSIATGVPSLPTPLGVFSVIQKQVLHHSNIYSNAPMPFMQRITWSGVALHEGENIGHPASHGCIRMPHDFAVRLFNLTKLGVRVIIARGELRPAEFADPHLFVHKDAPPLPQPAAPATADAVKTAPSLDGGKTIVVVSADAAAAAKPEELDLRLSHDGGTAAANVVAATDAPKPDAPKSDAAAMAVPKPDATPDGVPRPPAKPADVLKDLPAKKTPIAIFVSRKERRIYVRQDFEPLFDAPIVIAHPDQPLGTHVFTALEFLDDHATLRWNVVSLPGEPPAKPARSAENERQSEKHAGRRRDDDETKIVRDLPPPQTPAEALARIDIPQDVVDRISQMMVPGS
jgi:hypothetical protein